MKHPMSMSTLKCIPMVMVWLACATGATQSPVTLTQSPEELTGLAYPISLKSPTFTFSDIPVSESVAPAATSGAVDAPDGLVVTYPRIPLGRTGAMEVELHLRWEPAASVVYKWARYRLVNTAAALVLNEIVLEFMSVEKDRIQLVITEPQSYPAFMDGMFAGIEFPIASTRLDDTRLLIAHCPGILLPPDQWRESSKAVYGHAQKGEERKAFKHYMARLRPKQERLHINYNSWWTLPCPYAEADVLKLMDVFQKELYEKRGAHFDTFCIDMGWSNAKSLWEIDRTLFPEGFSRISQAAQQMQCMLGLWISPSSCYPPALDASWAKENGYEVNDRYLCLAGKEYQATFQQRLTEMVLQNDVREIKLDGYVARCPETDHGHLPGPLSSEAIAHGIIQAGQAAHKANRDTWLEPTCFGWNPSPWWLMYFDSVIGSYGDDAPYGRVPSPVYRESYTTARDYYNLQGAYWSPLPITAQEVLGIIHQTQEPFMNDAVMTVLRGHQFLPVYLNPAYMDNARWDMFAALLKWARQNESMLANTTPILPESWRNGRCPKFSKDVPMPREVYGYFHWKNNAALVVLRNPWIRPTSIRLRLDDSLDVPHNAKNLAAVSLYPEQRVYGKYLGYGGELLVPLNPYETVVLSLQEDLPFEGIAAKSANTGDYVSVQGPSPSIQRVSFTGPTEPFGPDWTCPLGGMRTAHHIQLEKEIQVEEYDAALLIAIDHTTSLGNPSLTLKNNGQAVSTERIDSQAGWAATGLDRPEYWIIDRYPLQTGQNALSLDIYADASIPNISGWIWSTRPGKPGASTYPNALPEPETLSLGGVELFTLQPSSIHETAEMERPIERINGIYLDVLEPASVTQGYGTLQKNKSVWEKEMTICGVRYQRGLGTHAPSRIAYPLNGEYKRFQAWAGADGATRPTITFEVKVDGQTRWESGLMEFDTPAQWVDVDVSGAQTLELLVGDADNMMSDHANWAEARLLK